MIGLARIREYGNDEEHHNHSHDDANGLVHSRSPLLYARSVILQNWMAFGNRYSHISPFQINDSGPEGHQQTRKPQPQHL
jgi:hypothetical protein